MVLLSQKNSTDSFESLDFFELYSCMTLANKYRPQKFEDFIGQDTNVRFLTNLIRGGQKACNIIFYGPFGSSKTTSLRVFARALNCLAPTSVGSPCNSCSSCVSFFDKTYSDYVEIDAATAGDKESLKSVRDIALLNPMLGKYRIFALDEVQQISKAGWDVLLTLVEETPQTTCFLFSTTEFEKVPETIKSRCFGLEVKLLNESQSIELLKRVSGFEGFKYEDLALHLISYISKGHPRDLIKNLEHVSCFGDISLQNVKLICNFADWEKIQILVNSLFEKNPNFFEIIKSWQISVSAMNNLLVYFFLHLKNKYMTQIEVDLHPVFKVIDSAFMLSIKNKIVELGGSFENSLNSLLSYLGKMTVSNEISFYLALNNLHSFIHINKFSFGVESKGFVKETESTAVVKKEVVRGRRFLGNYAEVKKVSKEEVRVLSVEEVKNKAVLEDKNSLHTDDVSSMVLKPKMDLNFLLQQGFVEMEKNKIKLQEIVE